MEFTFKTSDTMSRKITIGNMYQKDLFKFVHHLNTLVPKKYALREARPPITSVSALLLVVATPATFSQVFEWRKFLESRGIKVQNVATSNLAGFKDAAYLVLIGGFDEADGIKPLAETALNKTEFDRMSQAGSSAMYVKADVWGKNQQVIIFTGASGKDAERARKSHRAEWMDIIFGWFGSSYG
jgi:hypothetical protein